MTFWSLTNSDFPTDQTFHPFHYLYTELDLHRIMSGFHGAFATGVASQQGTLTLPDTWFRPPFWDLLMLQLLRPNTSNLPCLYSTFHLEYPLVLSRFSFSNEIFVSWPNSIIFCDKGLFPPAYDELFKKYSSALGYTQETSHTCIYICILETSIYIYLKISITYIIIRKKTKWHIQPQQKYDDSLSSVKGTWVYFLTLYTTALIVITKRNMNYQNNANILVMLFKSLIYAPQIYSLKCVHYSHLFLYTLNLYWIYKTEKSSDQTQIVR